MVRLEATNFQKTKERIGRRGGSENLYKLIKKRKRDKIIQQNNKYTDSFRVIIIHLNNN